MGTDYGVQIATTSPRMPDTPRHVLCLLPAPPLPRPLTARLPRARLLTPKPLLPDHSSPNSTGQELNRRKPLTTRARFLEPTTCSSALHHERDYIRHSELDHHAIDHLRYLAT